MHITDKARRDAFLYTLVRACRKRRQFLHIRPGRALPVRWETVLVKTGVEEGTKREELLPINILEEDCIQIKSAHMEPIVGKPVDNLCSPSGEREQIAQGNGCSSAKFTAHERVQGLRDQIDVGAVLIRLFDYSLVFVQRSGALDSNCRVTFWSAVCILRLLLQWNVVDILHDSHAVLDTLGKPLIELKQFVAGNAKPSLQQALLFFAEWKRDMCDVPGFCDAIQFKGRPVGVAKIGRANQVVLRAEHLKFKLVVSQLPQPPGQSPSQSSRGRDCPQI